MEAMTIPLRESARPYSARESIKGAESATLDHYIVVGDRIIKECSNERFISAAKAKDLAQRSTSPLKLHIGQGVNDQDLKQLYALEQGRVSIEPKRFVARACSATTHKHIASNIAISRAWDNGNGTYSSALMIDEENSQLSDHLTGQHISGMMIVEAARQMSIATAEQFYMDSRLSRKVNFISHSISVEFKDFLLPVPTEILCIPVSLKRSGRQNFRFSVVLQFRQQGQSLADIKIDTSVIDSRYFYLKENQLVHRYITKAN